MYTCPVAPQMASFHVTDVLMATFNINMATIRTPGTESTLMPRNVQS